MPRYYQRKTRSKPRKPGLDHLSEVAALSRKSSRHMAEGRCVDCGRVAVTKMHCEEHRLKTVARNRAWRIKHRHRLAKEQRERILNRPKSKSKNPRGMSGGMWSFLRRTPPPEIPVWTEPTRKRIAELLAWQRIHPQIEGIPEPLPP